MFMNFADATGGLFTDAASFFAADEATRQRAIRAWQAKDAEAAFTFRDKAQAFYQDAQVGYAFLTPQLHRIETEVYMRKYPSFDLNGVINVNEDGDMWDVGTVFYSMDSVGQAQFISGKGFDMPYADTNMQQFSHGFQLAGIGYEWSTQELERAAKLGRSLNADKAMAADKSAMAFKWSIAMTGRAPGADVSEKGWTGLVNNGAVPAATVAAGASTDTEWSTKTPDEIVTDFWGAVNAVETATGETMIANTVLLPTSRLRYLENTRMTDTGTTILAYLRGARDGGEALTIRGTRALETAGTSGSARMIAYDNSREVVQFHLPGDHQFLPPFQKSSMTYEVGGIMNIGGTEWRIPKGAAYRDGI